MSTRRLYRSRRDRFLGGVAAGIAEYFELDATLVRLGWVLLTLLGGSGLLIYLVAWVVVPEEPGSEDDRRGGSNGSDRRAGGDASGRRVAALLLVILLLVIGAVPLLLLVGSTFLGLFNVLIAGLTTLAPLILTIMVVALIVLAVRRRP